MGKEDTEKLLDDAVGKVIADRRILRKAVLSVFDSQNEPENYDSRLQRVKSELGDFGLPDGKIKDDVLIREELKDNFTRYNNLKKLHSELLFSNKGFIPRLTSLIYSSPENARKIIRADVHGIIEQKVFMFTDIPAFDDRTIQKILRYVEEDQLTRALIGQPWAVKDKFLRNVSQRVARNLVEEMKRLSSVSSEKEVLENQAAIVKVVMKLIEDKEIFQGTKFANDDRICY